MKRNIQMVVVCLAAISAAWMGCERAPELPKTAPGSVGGIIAGLDAGTEIVLRSFNNGNLVNVASAKLDSAGSFTLTPAKPLSRGYHQLLAGRKHPLVLITDQTEGVTIQATARMGENYMVGASIDGSPESVTISEYYDVIMPIQQRIKEAERDARSLDASKRSAAKDAVAAKVDSITSVSLEFAKNHITTLAALSALESLDASKHKDLFKANLTALKAEFSNSFYYGKIKAAYDRAMIPRKLDLSNPSNQSNQSTRKGKNSKYGQGEMAPDIVMNDPDGNERKLSDLRGKVVLLDFWASWCGPCRRENPNVVRAYEKYKNDGFEVFSVSLDSNVDRWRKAIEQDQLVWPNHVSDLQGWRNGAAREYGISSIPHTMLIDRDGAILATHLRGSGVDSALRGVFEK